jgi:hypothetical protein
VLTGLATSLQQSDGFQQRTNQRNEIPFVEALGLYQKQIIRYRNVSLSQ